MRLFYTSIVLKKHKIWVCQNLQTGPNSSLKLIFSAPYFERKKKKKHKSDVTCGVSQKFTRDNLVEISKTKIPLDREINNTFFKEKLNHQRNKTTL